MQKFNLLSRQSKEFKRLFILRFTKELIKNSGATEIFELENILRKREGIKEEAEEVFKEKEEKLNLIAEPFPEKREITSKLPLIKKTEIIFPPAEKKTSFIKKVYSQEMQSPVFEPVQRILRIPEPNLPPRLQYLKPFPTVVEINLEKLNPLVKDPAVNSIECNGPGENILVVGKMGTKKTSIVLDKEKIGGVIKKFSEVSKIPISEGVYKVVVGRLVLSAVISDIVGSKFIIRKMALLIPPPPIFMK